MTTPREYEKPFRAPVPLSPARVAEIARAIEAALAAEPLRIAELEAACAIGRRELYEFLILRDEVAPGVRLDCDELGRYCLVAAAALPQRDPRRRTFASPKKRWRRKALV